MEGEDDEGSVAALDAALADVEFAWEDGDERLPPDGSTDGDEGEGEGDEVFDDDPLRRCEELSAELLQQRREFALVSEERDDLYTQLDDLRRGELAARAREVDELRAALEASERSNHEAQQALRNALDTVEDQRIRLRSQANDMVAVQADLERVQQSSAERIAGLERRHRGMAKQMHDADAALAALRRDQARLQAAADNGERAVHEAAARVRDAVQKEREVKAKLQTMEAKLGAHRAAQRSVDSKADARAAHTAQLEARLERLTLERNQLRQQLKRRQETPPDSLTAPRTPAAAEHETSASDSARHRTPSHRDEKGSHSQRGRRTKLSTDGKPRAGPVAGAAADIRYNAIVEQRNVLAAMCAILFALLVLGLYFAWSVS